MSNEITSILQSLAPQHKVPGNKMTKQGPSASQSAMIEKPTVSKGDRVTLTGSAHLLHLAESKSAQVATPRLDYSEVGLNPVRTDNSERSVSRHMSEVSNAQRPSPAMANMMEAFLTTSDMDGFNVDSDLNADGVINFHDLAALRDIETDAAVIQPETPKAQVNNMTKSFFSSEGEENFDAASDLNRDGMINFQDLAILRSKMENN